MQMSPITARRWRNFGNNKRGFWSLWIFLILFVLSLGAEVIANDSPLLVRYDGSFYFPVLKAYPETTFGGDFETEAKYRDPFVQEDRKSVVQGKSVSVRVDLGGRLIIKRKKVDIETQSTNSPYTHINQH